MSRAPHHARGARADTGHPRLAPALGAAAAGLLFALGLPAWAVLPAAAVAAGSAPLVRRALARRRAARLAAQLPDALGALAAGLRAGRAFPQTFADVAAATPPPLGEELTLVARESGIGRPVEQGLDALLVRVPSDDLRLAVVALGLGRSLGGDLADLLDRVAETIRERQRLEARIRVLTSQGRAQGLILVLLPAGLALAIHAIDPAYLRPLVDTTTGRGALGLTALFEVAGAVAIRRIVALER